MLFKQKKLIAPSDKIQITHLGSVQNPAVYIFADVLDELVFYANQRSAWGLLTGQGYLLPVDKSLSTFNNVDKTPSISTAVNENVDKTLPPEAFPTDSDKPDYIEITAFRDIYPSVDALDYASHLRKMRDFRNSDENPVLGAVCLSQTKSELMLEDLLLQRSYFADPSQILLFVSADRKPPRAFRLDETCDHLLDAGLEIVSAVGTELPFDSNGLRFGQL